MLIASLSPEIQRTSEWIGSVDGRNIPITTQHSSSGTSEVVSIYIFNDGKRDSDGVDFELEYKNIKIKPRGKRAVITTALNNGIEPFVNTIPVNDPSWYTAGTKLLTDPIMYGGNKVQEEMWVKTIQGNNLIVDRGQNGTVALSLPDKHWLEAKPDHIYLSLTGQEGTWVHNGELTIPNIKDKWQPVRVYVKVSTGALKTQVKIDSYLSITSDEYPKIINF